ncbi:hypothetical protein [Enterobacter cloacae complex sp. 301C7]|uniref:hypothetical protein n=1 Tax=Enterobacter cloacae complex sp. 301C7 TaxID=3395848 RepID=UPI003CF0DD4A
MAEPVIFGTKLAPVYQQQKWRYCHPWIWPSPQNAALWGLGQMAGLSLFYRLRDWQFDTRDLHARDPI